MAREQRSYSMAGLTKLYKLARLTAHLTRMHAELQLTIRPVNIGEQQVHICRSEDESIARGVSTQVMEYAVRHCSGASGLQLPIG